MASPEIRVCRVRPSFASGETAWTGVGLAGWGGLALATGPRNGADLPLLA